MKFIVIHSGDGAGTAPIAQWYEADGAKELAKHLVRMGITQFSIALAPTSRLIACVPPKQKGYSPEIIATSKLAKVEIAAEDYNVDGKEVDGKHYFTFDEALEVQEKLKDTGWRLPTRSEWVLICEEFGQKSGELDAETLHDNLNMAPTGYLDTGGNLNERTTGGHWWSGTAGSATRGRYLNTWAGNVYAQTNCFRGYGFALRLVRDAKENN